MDRQDVKALFESLFREYSSSDSDGAVREGSVIVDQIINPLTLVMEPVFSEVKEVVEQNNPPNEAAGGDLLDAQARRFLTDRQEGAAASTDIRLLLSDPSQVQIPSGSSVFARDREFQTTRRARFSAQQFTEVVRDGQTVYESPDIPVEAIEQGPSYEVGAEAIQTPSFAVDNLIGVYNPTATTSGAVSESDEALRSRLRRSISSRAFDTEDGLRFQLGEQFGGTVRNIHIAEPGDEEIERSTVRTYRNIDRVGYQNKTKGSSEPNGSLLYYRTIREKLGSPSIYEAEVRQEDYNSVTSIDLSTLSISTDVLYEDDFSRTQDFKTALGEGWIAGNTGERWRKKDSASGIFLNDSNLVMGPRNLRQKQEPVLPDPKDSFPELTLPVFTLSTTEADRERAEAVNQTLRQQGVPAETRRRVVQEITRPREYPVEGYRGIENNTSPVLQRKITQPYGFRITGTFQTTDPERPACVSMARIENPDDLSTIGRGDAKFRWFEGFGFVVKAGDGGTPNLFITDNASTARQMSVVGERHVGGGLEFDTLSQTSIPVDTQTNYQYEMMVGAPAQGENGMTMSVRVWEEQSGSRPSNATLDYGAYVPENRREELLKPDAGDITTPSTNPLDATHVGIGVSSTGGQEYWTFGEFRVENIQQSYPQAISEIDVSNISSNEVEIDVIARGKGLDDTGTETYGHDIYVWNETNQEWETPAVDAPRYDSFSFWSSQMNLDLTDRVTGSGHLRFLITSAFPHEGPAPVPTISELDVDQITGRSYNGSVDVGGMSDLFFVQDTGDNKRPSVVKTHTISDAGSIETLSPEDFGGPIAEIERVYSGGPSSDVVLEEGVDYRYFWAGDGKRGSMNETVHLPVNVGGEITVEAHVHNEVPGVHDFINTSPQRKVDADLLPRHKRPVWIDFTADVTGVFAGSPEEEVRSWIRDRTEETIDISMIVALLQDQGAASVNTQTATLTARRLTDDGNMESTAQFSHSRTDVETFVPGPVNLTVQA